MIKIIFFDYDGTLYSHKTKKIPSSTLKALKILKEKGIKLFLCTGRSLNEIQNINIEDLNLDGYITTNGAVIYDYDFNLIYAADLNEDLKEKVIKDFNEKKVSIMLTNHFDQYVNFEDKNIKNALDKFKAEVPRSDTYKNEEIVVAYYYFEKIDDKLKKEAHVKEEFVYKYETEVIPKSNSKASGISNLIKILNIRKEETMAFGDEDNDTEMLDFCKYSIAMNNGSQNLKSHATYVTSDIDEDGIYKALKYYNLI